MVCRLCLTGSNDSIVIFSEDKIQKYIKKFLQLQLSPEDPVSKIICALCWQQLENFQSFCFRVEEAQKSLCAYSKELKEEDNQNGQDAPSIEKIPFESLDTGTSFNPLKEEDVAKESDDEPVDTSNSFHFLDEEMVKVEIYNEDNREDTISTPPEINESPTRRITRRTKLKRPITPEKDVLPDVKAKRKCGRPKKEKVAEKQRTPDTAEKQETSDKEDKAEEEITLNGNAKRRRGRPKKGEKRTEVKKVRSEKCERILETAKEFNDIIQKNMNLTCNICSAHLVDFSELKRHYRAVHNCKGYAVCCNKRLYKRGVVVDHINKHNNPDYFKCNVCSTVLANRMCLRDHVLLMHQNEVDKVYQCAYCPKKYAKQYHLDRHRLKHIPQEECTFMCAECGKGFPAKARLTYHLNQIHSAIYDKMCEICAKLIRGNTAFERHMDEHHGIVRPQVQCQICGSWLKDKNSLRKHMYKHDGKSYSCNVCGRNAPSKSALQSHFRYVHQTVRQFHCTFCDKAFKKAVSLREHLTIHTGEVLYTCPHCPKTFNSKANMHAHRKKIHREEWEANRYYNIKQATSTETNSVAS